MIRVINRSTEFKTEQAVQDWLELQILSGTFHTDLQGVNEVHDALAAYESDYSWPTFPVDYLTRLQSLRSARYVVGSLNDLQIISKNNSSISRQAGEQLFADLLCSGHDNSRFIIFEVKNRKASAREAITELLAYEHEVLNHIPFAATGDILMVVVARDFPVLLDHALTGLITWSRRKILCLHFDDSAPRPVLKVHIPKAWSAVGQTTLPAAGIKTANLTLIPRQGLEESEILAVCETAAALIVRESERAGGSGFAMVVKNHLYPNLACSPYSIMAGVMNPFSFLPDAESAGLTTPSSSKLAAFILNSDNSHDSWNWLSSDACAAAKEYLGEYGDPLWEGLSDWQNLRNVERWRVSSLTPDRHLKPVSIDFWGIIGDYAREIIRQTPRLKNAVPGIVKPGLDWRHPRVGVLLLDGISIPPVIDSGQWHFSSIFAFGLRLGRVTSLTAQYADAKIKTKKLLAAAVFWAEVDIVPVIDEIVWRVAESTNIKEKSLVFSIGKYDSGREVIARTEEFAKWFRASFIGDNPDLLREAFDVGFNCYCLFDPQYPATLDRQKRAKWAAAHARDWLMRTWTVAEEHPRSKEIHETVHQLFGKALDMTKGKEEVMASVNALNQLSLMDKLFSGIPKLIDLWQPPLAHILKPTIPTPRDWDWMEDEIRAARARGEKYPCIKQSAGGQFGIGKIPSTGIIMPEIRDPSTEVLFVINRTTHETIVIVTWDDLRAGKIV